MLGRRCAGALSFAALRKHTLTHTHTHARTHCAVQQQTAHTRVCVCMYVCVTDSAHLCMCVYVSVRNRQLLRSAMHMSHVPCCVWYIRGLPMTHPVNHVTYV